MEESKYLLNLQVAGLIIQNSLKFLTSSLDSYNKRKLCSHFSIWKFKTLELPKHTQIKIKNSASLFISRLRSVLISLNSSVKSILRDTLVRIIIRSKYSQIDECFQSEEIALKVKHQDEFQSLSKELKSTQDCLDDLDKKFRKMKHREELLKNQIQEISAKKNEILKNRRKFLRDKEDELSERIEELKEENSDIKEKIAMIENNVSNFIGEMGGLLEQPEADRASERRKSSLKKNRSGKKGKIPLFTIDMSKN